MVRLTLRWTSVQIRGGRNTPSCFLLQKSDKLLSDELFGSYADLTLLNRQCVFHMRAPPHLCLCHNTYKNINPSLTAASFLGLQVHLISEEKRMCIWWMKKLKNLRLVKLNTGLSIFTLTAMFPTKLLLQLIVLDSLSCGLPVYYRIIVQGDPISQGWSLHHNFLWWNTYKHWIVM